MKNNSKNIKIFSGAEVISLPLKLVGGKAKGLSFLLKHGLITPEFYVIDYESAKLCIEYPDLLKNAISEWANENKIVDDVLWAVRSSAANEDGNEKSFAGQFTSVLNLKKDELAEGIRKVVKSYNRDTEYAEKATTFGIIIQKMLAPDYSGVFFSRDPILHYRNQPVISIVPGIGDKLVSGELDGFYINFKDNKPIYNSEDEIIGEFFNEGQRSEIKRTSSQIITALQSHIKEMLEIANRLESVKKVALDFEFAIEKGKFFWLQIRPITTRELNPTVEVWDNTSAEANYPEITLPLSISFVKRTFLEAYGGGAKSIGFTNKVLQENSHLIANMAGEINGALYYNVTAWQMLIFQMPFGKTLSQKLPDLWGMEKTVFQIPKAKHKRIDKLRILITILSKFLNGKHYEKEYLKLFHHHIVEFDKKNIQKDNLKELIARYQKIENELGSKWLAPVLNGFNTMLLFTLLKKKIHNSKISNDYPNFINDILSAEGNVKSVQLVRKFQEIMQKIFDNDDLKLFFAENDQEYIWKQLPIKFKAIYSELCSYIEEFGNRTDQGELKLETINYKQNPVLLIQFIQSNLKGYKPISKTLEVFDYKSIVREYYTYNIFSRWFLNKLIEKTIKRIKARENYRFMRTDTFAVIRTLFLQMGKLLEEDGIIDSARDVLYLEIEELFNLSKQEEYKLIIEDRKKAYLEYDGKERSNRYIKVKNSYFEIEENETVLDGNKLKGVACCSGIVTDRVVIINGNTDFNQDFTNCILVASYFEPGWINLFYQAKGILSERGNLLSHTAIICRELKLPSIVGVKGILKKIKNGDIVTMDGGRGIITIHENE